ncbi:uncharacterized protein RJT21DRAFT_112758 [Scheffersomyces amazonensis]|uniref:uncharacterized protein n=1 Tax=Scheffersomyces amazonensis TaxID=1078765 RepID=UPI00315CF8C9
MHSTKEERKDDTQVGILVLIAIFIPPLTVFMKRGCGGQLFLNLILLFFGFIPAMIHAIYIALADNKKDKDVTPVAAPAGPPPQATNAPAPAPGTAPVQHVAAIPEATTTQAQQYEFQAQQVGNYKSDGNPPTYNDVKNSS